MMENRVENDYSAIDDIQLSQKFEFRFSDDENEEENFNISMSPEERRKGFMQNSEWFSKSTMLLNRGLSIDEGMKNRIMNKFTGELYDVEGEGENEMTFSTTKITPFDSKEFNAAFAVVSEGSSYIDPSQIEDVFLALGYTLQDSDIRELMLDVHPDKKGKVGIDTLLHAYTAWKKNTTTFGGKINLQYEENVAVLFKLLMKEKRIPSTYRINSLKSAIRNLAIGSEGLDKEILANILAQGTLDENIYDHEDIHPDDVENVLRELISYTKQGDSSRASNLISQSSFLNPEDTDFLSLKDFFRFMAFR